MTKTITNKTHKSEDGKEKKKIFRIKINWGSAKVKHVLQNGRNGIFRRKDHDNSSPSILNVGLNDLSKRIYI